MSTTVFAVEQRQVIHFCLIVDYFSHRSLTLCFQPSNLTREHFVLKQKRSGDYAGKEALRLLNHKCEKTKKWSLGDFHCRKSDGQFDMVEFASDEFSIVKLYKHIEEHFMPDAELGLEVRRFFRRRAASKELRKRRKKGVSFTVGLHQNDVWGKGYFDTQMKDLAKRCGFINAARCTGQGKRAEGVSRLVNSKEGIPLCESMRASRHSSVEAHLGYTEPDEEAHSKRYCAMAATTNSEEDKVCFVVLSHEFHYHLSTHTRFSFASVSKNQR